MAKLFVTEHLGDQDNTPVMPTVSDEGSSQAWAAAEYEGQLSVDVYQTEDSIVITSTMAGVNPEDLEVTLNNDVVTIRGKRQPEQVVRPEDYFYRECYWGGFSRSIVLPVEVHAESVSARLRHGVLTVVLPKAPRSKAVAVKVEPEDET
jgi:HSP20 family protein